VSNLKQLQKVIIPGRREKEKLDTVLLIYKNLRKSNKNSTDQTRSLKSMLIDLSNDDKYKNYLRNRFKRKS